MPTVFRFGRIKVAIYADDHNPPHFHILTPDHSAIVAIETLEITHGYLPKHDYEVAIAWARNNMELLRSTWAGLNEQH